MKILGVAVVVFISTFGNVESPIGSLSQIQELVSAPSYVPEEELYTHIAGGYFSSYDMKTGQFRNSEIMELPELKSVDFSWYDKADGSIKIILTGLKYESRFVYLPEGELILTDGSGNEKIFSLKKLDYVQIEDSDIPVYRLSARDQKDNMATLISTSVGIEIPSLVGTLYVENEEDIESYLVRICGRNNFDQENHLCKKIENVSHFFEDSSKLTFGNNATGDQKLMAENAYDKAKSVYKDMGFDLSGLVSPLVYFGSPVDWNEDVLTNTIALYNSDEKYILMTPFDSDFYQNSDILGTKGNGDMYFSILFHEFCHHLNNYINPEIVPHHDEFIACALQLATLDENFLEQVISQFKGFSFEKRSDITLLAYISTPKEFQVASYLFGQEHELQINILLRNSQYLVRDPFLVSRL